MTMTTNARIRKHDVFHTVESVMYPKFDIITNIESCIEYLLAVFIICC